MQEGRRGGRARLPTPQPGKLLGMEQSYPPEPPAQPPSQPPGPDAPYPLQYTVDYSHPTQAGLEVGLNPSAGHPGTRRLTFYIGFKKFGTGAKAHWVVNYWSPRYRPPVPATQ